ncbi:hypothetical protein MIMGU_mgv1a016592mg [Erythranthe guttata]|uniref:Uncharacterized protein n=1 Tax=Erythranthe guttata TaxID=4155 RepID=A0A022RP07_ERYGU|nr:hypothetical protein MIMGU_mgv1a016592mg [Erythranthe guttata]
MAVFTNIRPNNRLPIIMVPEIPPQTKRRMQIPCLFRATIYAIQFNYFAPIITDCPPNPRLFEILENTPKQHVVTLLLNVNATWPITNVQAIPLKPTRQQFIPLLSAQIPNPRRQM